jgi:hypothetical protein
MMPPSSRWGGLIVGLEDCRADDQVGGASFMLVMRFLICSSWSASIQVVTGRALESSNWRECSSTRVTLMPRAYS